jgi:hypothetical protein
MKIIVYEQLYMRRRLGILQEDKLFMDKDSINIGGNMPI